MMEEREAALEAIFETPTGRMRTSAAAAALAAEALDALVPSLEAGDHLGDDYGPARRQVDRAIREGAMRLGCACLDGMRGMIAEGVIGESFVMPRAADGAFASLDDKWQKDGTPYRDAARIATSQKSTLEKLSAQPSQLTRRLCESVALAADLAAWTAWVLPD
jgi:hypothetical protein